MITTVALEIVLSVNQILLIERMILERQAVTPWSNNKPDYLELAFFAFYHQFLLY
jgi:hypothetical protein